MVPRIDHEATGDVKIIYSHDHKEVFFGDHMCHLHMQTNYYYLTPLPRTTILKDITRK